MIKFHFNLINNLNNNNLNNNNINNNNINNNNINNNNININNNNKYNNNKYNKNNTILIVIMDSNKFQINFKTMQKIFFVELLLIHILNKYMIIRMYY